MNPKSKLFVFLSSRVLTIGVLGSILMGLVSTFANDSAQIAMLGGLVSILIGLVLEIIEQDNARDKWLNSLNEHLGVPRTLAQESTVFRQYEKLVSDIAKSLNIRDELFKSLATQQLDKLGDATENLANGVIEFRETETWRVAYEELLRDEKVKLYRSVALVTSKDYWQDSSGKKSLELNYQLQDEKGLSIERIVIVADSLWPWGELFPQKSVFEWLLEQHSNGVSLELVRESEILDEPELNVDFGIYGTLATGRQELDSVSRTTRFVLSFNPQDIQHSNQRWDRLKLFSNSMRKLLDRLDD